jgi:hypothetical protein
MICFLDSDLEALWCGYLLILVYGRAGLLTFITMMSSVVDTLSMFS